MISEHSRVELTGKIISVVVDDACELTFWGLKMGVQPDTATPKEVAKLLNDIAVEATEIRDRIEELIEASKEPTVPSVMIYDDIKALTSHHARELAYRRFYADESNRNVVLTVTSSEAVTANRDAENVYKVSGYTKPRQKRLRGTLAPVQEKKDRDLTEFRAPKVGEANDG